MPYATAADLRVRFDERQLAALTDPQGKLADDAKLLQACTDASAEIDGYLQARYVVPAAPVPLVLVDRCCDIAIYKLARLKPQATVASAKERCDEATAWLRDVSKGVVTLALNAAGQAPAPATTGPILTDQADRLFGTSSLERF